MIERGEGKVVNQSSIVGYAHFPGTTVYAATKAGVAALTAALRRELQDTGVTTLELITGGTDTEMLEQAADQLSDHTDPSNWEFRDPDEWADKIVAAIKDDTDRLEPLGKSRLARLAGMAPTAVMDQVAKRAWD
jgi:short-subunit dehydrogenase